MNELELMVIIGAIWLISLLFVIGMLLKSHSRVQELERRLSISEVQREEN